MHQRSIMQVNKCTLLITSRFHNTLNCCNLSYSISA